MVWRSRAPHAAWLARPYQGMRSRSVARGQGPPHQAAEIDVRKASELVRAEASMLPFHKGGPAWPLRACFK